MGWILSEIFGVDSKIKIIKKNTKISFLIIKFGKKCKVDEFLMKL